MVLTGLSRIRVLTGAQLRLVRAAGAAHSCGVGCVPASVPLESLFEYRLLAYRAGSGCRSDFRLATDRWSLGKLSLEGQPAQMPARVVAGLELCDDRRFAYFRAGTGMVTLMSAYEPISTSTLKLTVRAVVDCGSCPARTMSPAMRWPDER